MPEQRWGYNSWEDYYIPGTKTVRNKFRAPGKPYGEPNPNILHAKEEAASFLRMHELRLRPITGDFDYAHMKAIHGYIFQDVYDWAGEPRVGPHGWMTKEGPNVLHPNDPDNPTMAFTYYPGTEIMHEDARKQYRRLAEKNYLRGLEKQEFVQELAEIWGELNIIHVFREGNTRTQFIFFEQLCRKAGYQIASERFAVRDEATMQRAAAAGRPYLREAFVRARFYSQATGSNKRLAEVLDQAISPLH